MSLTRITCPECGVGLKSPTGFTVGETVHCKKCETYFAVEEPGDEAADADRPQKARPAAPTPGKAGTKKPLRAAADDEDENDAPKARKKKRADDTEKSYKTSPLRFVILGGLLVVLGVLGFMLYQKKQKEKEDAAKNDALPPADSGVVGGRGPGPLGPGGVGFQGPIDIPAGGVIGGGRPGMGRPGMGDGAGRPIVDGKTSRPTGGGGDPISNFFSGPALTDAEKEALKKQFQDKLIGTWVADLGGTTVELVYTPTGDVTETKKVGSGPSTTANGKWRVVGLVGHRGLIIQREGIGRIGTPRPETILFEGDELEHPVPSLNLTGVFRKK